MPNIWIYTLVSVLIVSLLSFVGVFALSIRTDRLKKILIYLVSFSAGALFGDVFIHLLPEIVAEHGFKLSISIYVMAGIAAFFVLEKIIKWHHYHFPHTKAQAHPFAIANLVGDALHNFIDGIIIAASYMISIPAGIATTLAVVFHEIPQEIGDFGVLLHGGFTKAKALFFNFLSALTAILGAAGALLVGSQIENVTLVLVPFAAGGFIYIAGTDLIPEMHKEVEVKKSILQFAAFGLGIGIMLSLLLLE